MLAGLDKETRRGWFSGEQKDLELRPQGAAKSAVWHRVGWLPVTVGEQLFSPVKIPQLHAEVQAQIRTLIDNGILKPGQTLPSERELASQLGVSRNSLREALRVLEARGIVITRHGVGRTIRETGPVRGGSESPSNALETATIVEVLEVREALEWKAVALACVRATDEQLRQIEISAEAGGEWEHTLAFHAAIAAAAHNYVLEQIIVDQLVLLDALRQRDRYPSPRDVTSLIAEHREIATAIKARDVTRSLALIKEHLRSSRDRVEEGS